MSRCGGIHDYMPIFTTRACPFECIYCHQMFGKGFRTRSPENVLAEIRTLYEKHNVREFEIIDDIFNCDLQRAKQIFDMIIESGMNIRFTSPTASAATMLMRSSSSRPGGQARSSWPSPSRQQRHDSRR